MPETVVRWAQSLVDEVAPDANVYGSHPTYVDWSDGASGHARNRSVCSSFVSAVLRKSFGYSHGDIDAWFGKKNPQAVEYHDTIVARRGFERIVHVTAIRPGDILAIAYAPGAHPTGHVMIAASHVSERRASAPYEAGTQQYEIEVIDSAASAHGPADTRRLSGGRKQSGVGKGTLRLYARPDGTIAGYTWSTLAASTFRPADVRKPAIGRLVRSRVPSPTGTVTMEDRTDESTPAADDAPFDDRD